jgi:hypothetical protein
MQFKPFVLVILGLAIGLGGCLNSPPPFGPSPVAAPPYLGCVTPMNVAISCASGNWACPHNVAVHNSAQLLSFLGSCGIACQAPSDPCNFNTQMMIGVLSWTGCSGSNSLSSVCYFTDHVEVTILTTYPAKGEPTCNEIPIAYVAWVAVPASNLPVIFN